MTVCILNLLELFLIATAGLLVGVRAIDTITTVGGIQNPTGNPAPVIWIGSVSEELFLVQGAQGRT